MLFIKKNFNCPKKLLQAYGDSDICNRNENQDNYLIMCHKNNETKAVFLKDQKKHTQIINDWNKEYIRIAVADGMGGHAHGRQISEKLIQELIKLEVQKTPDQMRKQILDLNIKLYDQYLPHNERSPGTTLILADIEVKTGKGVMINVGDCRAYILNKKPFMFNNWYIKQITYDQTDAEYSYRDGEMEKKDYMAHKNSNNNRIVQAIGFGSMGIIKDDNGRKPYRPDKNLRIDIESDLVSELKSHADSFYFQIKKNQILMISSDGLWSGISNGQWYFDKNISELNQDLVSHIIKEGLSKNANDNITVILCGFKTD